MGRTARDNRDRPHPKPVQKIILPEGNIKRRLIAAGLFLLLGAAALAYSFSRLMTPETGWQPIEASSAEEANCGNEFVFLYELGAGGTSPTAENRAVSALYTGACRKLFRLFHTMESFEGVTNLRDVNLHPNETLTVDAELYRAFEAVQRHGDRTVYLGPVYARYNDLFNCADDAQLVDFDPYLSDEVREEYAAVAAFACDPQAIDLRLLGEGKVCLYVSQGYLAYAKQTGIERFLDFGWLKNAFIADEIARVMVDSGYTHGSISSCDGFIRNLDDREVTYAVNVYDLADGSVYPAARMEYRGPMSVAYLRDYPISGLDGQRLYQLKSGQTRSTYLDPSDGLCKSAVHDLICYSAQDNCADVALQIAPVYVAQTLDVQALDRLAERGVYSIRCRSRVLVGTDPELTLTNLYEEGGVRYEASVGRYSQRT